MGKLVLPGKYFELKIIGFDKSEQINKYLQLSGWKYFFSSSSPCELLKFLLSC